MEFDRLGDSTISPFECLENNNVKLKFVPVELRWNGFKSHAGRKSGWNELNRNNQVLPHVTPPRWFDGRFANYTGCSGMWTKGLVHEFEEGLKGLR